MLVKFNNKESSNKLLKDDVLFGQDILLDVCLLDFLANWSNALTSIVSTATIASCLL